MDSTFVRMTILGSLVSLISLLAGCDVSGGRPDLPRTATGVRPDVMPVSADDATEVAFVTAVEKSRVNYKYRLEVLRSFYNRIGNGVKYNQVGVELNNLAQAQPFRWRNIEVAPPPGEAADTASTDEQLLVEYLSQARRAYKDSMEELAGYYERKGQTYLASVARCCQDRLLPDETFYYIDGREYARPDLKPTQVIPEADAMFNKALSLHQSGKILPAIHNKAKQRQALGLFRDLIEKYPSSDKIALSAYYLGEIYKEYLENGERSVRWYERAYTWDPNIPRPARFQAAVVWDYRLQDRARALQLYKAAVQREQFNSSNAGFASRRIAEIEGGRS